MASPDSAKLMMGITGHSPPPSTPSHNPQNTQHSGHRGTSRASGSSEQPSQQPNAQHSEDAVLEDSFSDDQSPTHEGGAGHRGNNVHVHENVFHITKGYNGPKFYPEKIDIWFIQFELFLASNRFTADKTKFSQLAQAIDTETLALVGDAILSPPTTNQYDNLKKRLLGHYAKTLNQRIHDLVSNIQLGDKKPTTLLAELRRAAGTMQTSEEFINSMWLARLPRTMRNIVSAAPVTLDEKAIVADKIKEQDDLDGHVSVVTHQQSSSSSSGTDFQQRMESEISAINQRLNEYFRPRGRSHSKSRDRTQYRNHTPHRSRQRSHGNRDVNSQPQERRICWFHQRHGPNATNCEPPCMFFIEGKHKVYQRDEKN